MYILEINHGSGEIHRYFLLPGEEYTIGRKECRVLLPNAESQPSISRHHATISVSAIPKYAAMDPKAQVEIVLRDYSKHGTFVDRERVGRDNARFIYPEDRIRFGLRVTARVLPVTLPLVVSPTIDQKSLEVLLEAAVQIGAVVMEDHVPAPADFYQKHINCVGFLFVSDDKFTMDGAMMEALGLGYTLATTNYIAALVREIKANDRLMPSEFSAPVPPIPASMALRSVHYRRPVQTFYSPLEFLSVGSPVVSTVFEDYTMLVPDDHLFHTVADIIALFGGAAEKAEAKDVARYRALATTNPQALVVLTERTFNRVSELVISGGGKGSLATPSPADTDEVTAGLLLYRCGLCLIPEENIQLALYRDDPLELKDKTGACYLQRAREDVEADTTLVASPSQEPVGAEPATPPQLVSPPAAKAVEPPVAEPRLGSPSVDATAATDAAGTNSEEPVGRRSASGSLSSGGTARPTQGTVLMPEKSTSAEGSAARSDAGTPKTSQPRSSVGSTNGRGSSHLPPKTGGGAAPAVTLPTPPVPAAVVASSEAATQPEPTSAHSTEPDNDKDREGSVVGREDSAIGTTPGKPTPTTSATTTPSRSSAIPPRHQPLSSAVAINRRVAERRRSLGGSPSEPPTDTPTATRSPSNRLPPKNIVTGGASSARKTRPLEDATTATTAPRRLPVSSAPTSSAARALETPNNLGEDDDGRGSGSLSESRPVVVHAASQVNHSPTRQRVEPVKIASTYSDRRYSLPRGSAGPEEDGEWPRQRSNSTQHADPSEGLTRSGASAGEQTSSSRAGAGGTAASRIKRQAVRRESVANRASVTRRASQSVTYQRSDSSRNGPLESASTRSVRSTATHASNSSVPRSGRATRTGHHPHSLASPTPVREASTTGGGEMGSMSDVAPVPTQTSARRRRSGSLSGAAGLPPPVPQPSLVGSADKAAPGRAASVMPISNSSMNEGYHADAQLGLQCESFSKSFLQGFTSETEKVSRMVLRQTYMDSNSKQFFEDGATRLADFLEYMIQHEKEVAPMFSTEATRRSCNDIRQNATYVLRKIKGTFDSVKVKAPASVQQCRDVLNSRQRSPARHQPRYNSVSGHGSDSAYRRPSRLS